MTEPMNIDTMDLIVVVIGVVFGLTVMYMNADTALGMMIEADGEVFDFALMVCAGIPLFIKRQLIPTPTRRVDAPVSLRMVYLLTAILGALAVGGALVATWLALRAHQNIDTMVGSIGGVGMVLLIIAMLIELLAIRA